MVLKISITIWMRDVHYFYLFCVFHNKDWAITQLFLHKSLAPNGRHILEIMRMKGRGDIFTPR
jgi:hypothetical protein